MSLGEGIGRLEEEIAETKEEAKKAKDSGDVESWKMELSHFQRNYLCLESLSTQFSTVQDVMQPILKQRQQ